MGLLIENTRQMGIPRKGDAPLPVRHARLCVSQLSAIPQVERADADKIPLPDHFVQQGLQCFLFFHCSASLPLFHFLPV